MEKWPAVRLSRAKEQAITCEGLECSQSGCFIFFMRGSTGERYTVEVEEDIDLWPPTCTCEDHIWRPDLLCKHIIYCMRLMGVDEACPEEWCWEPSTQEEVYGILMNAPDVVGT